MNTSETAYWTAMVQVLPVLGIALVVEARAGENRLSSIYARGMRRFVAFNQTLSALGLAFSLPIAIAALREDEAPGAAMQTLVSYAIGWSIATIIFSPMIIIIFGQNPGGLARFVDMISSPTKWLYLRRVRRLLKSQIRLVRHHRSILHAHMVDLTGLASKHEGDVGYTHTREEVQEVLDGLRRDFRKSIVRELNFPHYRANILEQIEDQRGRDRNMATRLITEMFGDPTAHGAKPLVSYVTEEPDDGGFLPEGEPIEMPNLLALDHIVSEASQWRREAGRTGSENRQDKD